MVSKAQQQIKTDKLLQQVRRESQKFARHNRWFNRYFSSEYIFIPHSVRARNNKVQAALQDLEMRGVSDVARCSRNVCTFHRRCRLGRNVVVSACSQETCC